MSKAAEMPPRWPIAEQAYLCLLGAACVATGVSHFLQQWLLFFVFVAAMLLPRQSANRVPWAVWGGLVIWALAVIFADVNSPFGAEIGTHGMISLWMLLILPAVLRAPESARQRLHVWLSLLALGLAISSALAVWQFFTGSDPWRDRPLDTAWFSPHWTRGRGLQTNPMTYSGMLGLMAVFLAGHARHTRSTRWMAVSGAFLIGMAIGISRSYLLVVPVCMVAVWAIGNVRRVALAWTGMCAVLAVGMVTVMASADSMPLESADVTVIAERPAVRIPPAFERVIHWRNSLAVIREFPITGVGQGGEMPALDAANPVKPVVATRSTHNLFLRLLVQTGIVGLWAFGAMVLLVGHGLRQIGGQRQTALGLVGLLAAVGLFENAFFDSEIQQLFWLLLGISTWAGRGAGARIAAHAGAENFIMPIDSTAQASAHSP